MNTDSANTNAPPEPSTDTVPAGEWNYRYLAWSLVIALVLQILLLPCLCWIGRGKMIFALIFDGLWALRIIVAALLHEKGKGWIFYAILMATSGIWIALAGWIIFKH